MRQRVGIARALAVDPAVLLHGRAVLGAGRPDAHADDGGAPRHLGAHAQDHPLRDAQHPGGGVHGRPGDRALAAARARCSTPCRSAFRGRAASASRAIPPSSQAADRIWGLIKSQAAGRAARRRPGGGARLMAVERFIVADRTAFLRRPRAPRGAGPRPGGPGHPLGARHAHRLGARALPAVAARACWRRAGTWRVSGELHVHLADEPRAPGVGLRDRRRWPASRWAWRWASSPWPTRWCSRSSPPRSRSRRSRCCRC